MIAALNRVVGGLGEHIVPLLSPRSGTSTQGVMTALINRLQDQPEELALILDDYHLIEVKKHTSHIFDKLGAASRTQAVAHARRLGLIA